MKAETKEHNRRRDEVLLRMLKTQPKYQGEYHTRPLDGSEETPKVPEGDPLLRALFRASIVDK